MLYRSRPRSRNEAWGEFHSPSITFIFNLEIQLSALFLILSFSCVYIVQRFPDFIIHKELYLSAFSDLAFLWIQLSFVRKEFIVSWPFYLFSTGAWDSLPTTFGFWEWKRNDGQWHCESTRHTTKRFRWMLHHNVSRLRTTRDDHWPLPQNWSQNKYYSLIIPWTWNGGEIGEGCFWPETYPQHREDPFVPPSMVDNCCGCLVWPGTFQRTVI
jgi:hypothetical protein